MQIIHTFGHLVGGTLLVAGTSIGVGMLALPVVMANSGFLPSILLYVICWIFMLLTGLLILEACVWMPKNANLITLSERLLGRWGKGSCWILYLFLFSCLMIAHIAGGGEIGSELTGGILPKKWGMILYVLLFGPVIYLGTLWVDRINLLFMTGVAIAYIALISSSIHYITPSFLGRVHFTDSFAALPMILTAFGYQSLVPTLFNYMNRDIARVRLALILGTFIPLIVYIFWQLMILGIVPLEGSQGLASALIKKENAIIPLSSYLHNTSLRMAGKLFVLFSITTSYLGISVAFLDFLFDGFKIKPTPRTKIVTCSCMFLIPLAICLFNSHLFLLMLRWTGGIGVTLLLGLLPILMVWKGRYYAGHSLMHEQVKGGKFTLSALLAFVLFVLGVTFAT